jgi:hypothetical protein
VLPNKLPEDKLLKLNFTLQFAVEVTSRKQNVEEFVCCEAALAKFPANDSALTV